MSITLKTTGLATLGFVTLLSSGLAQASSHREAPFITKTPKVDATDFYMFRSYESGRSGFVTLVANYLPLQDAYGGPNYFDLDPDALYEIHIDNNGDAKEDITYQFRFEDEFNDLQLNVGGKMVSVPLKNIGDATDSGNVQASQRYTVTVVTGDRRQGAAQMATNIDNGTEYFDKPLDNIGEKSFGTGYASYADQHIFAINLPGCSTPGRVFVGQRKEAFAVNLGEIFDLVNTNPLGARDAEGAGDLADKNVTSLALEVPTSCLTGSAKTSGGDPVIGAWTTASVRQATVMNPAPTALGGTGKGASVTGGAYVQVSRLGMPLVNEVVIGLKDKDRFNASEPMDDGQFLTYVTNPTLPALLEVLFGGAGAQAPATPRNDLVAAFLTGVDGLNQPVGVTASEMLRLNTAIAVTAPASQNDLGVLGGDNAGFPNGRRPVDDVVDSELRVAMGALTTDAPNKDAPFTDGVQLDPSTLLTRFPYLGTPMSGSPNGL